MQVDPEKNALCVGYIVEFIRDATKNEYMVVGISKISSVLSMCLKF